MPGHAAKIPAGVSFAKQSAQIALDAADKIALALRGPGGDSIDQILAEQPLDGKRIGRGRFEKRRKRREPRSLSLQKPHCVLAAYLFEPDFHARDKAAGGRNIRSYHSGNARIAARRLPIRQ